MNLNWAANLWQSRRISSTERSTVEEQKEIIDKAEKLDQVIDLPGWEEICRYMVSEVQANISQATRLPNLSKRQQAEVIRWNAKRELLDGTLGWIESIRRSRDEIVEQYRNLQGEQNG